VTHKEGGSFSSKRIYLRVVRQGVTFDICGAPFGSGFFASWWLGDKPMGLIKSVFSLFVNVPVLGALVDGMFVMTYWKIDSMTMYQEQVHTAVMEVLDQLTESQGLQRLSEDQRKPTMKLKPRNRCRASPTS
jgi:hypothetical protein